MIDPELLAVARGERPADLLLRGGRVVNVFSGEVVEANVAVHVGADGGRIAGVGDYASGKVVEDLRGAYISPGFIDAHMHVESTMLPPSEFVKLAAPHGTTGAVFDPHEIANVLGIAGIKYVMDDAEGLPLRAMFALSSCVPSSHLETSGARLSAADLAPLFDDPRVVALAEMMNFPGVVNGSPEVLEKVALGLSRRVVDGHAPRLTGRGLQAYVAAGISSDHECTTREEAEEKLRLGMRIYIREGSAARNLDALLPAVNAGNSHRFCFCTDDRHPADLRDEGHIDHVVRRAIAGGLDPARAIAMASINVAEHYRVRDVGAIAPGYRADMIVCDDLAEVRARRVYVGGELVAADGVFVRAPKCPRRRQQRRLLRNDHFRRLIRHQPRDRQRQFRRHTPTIHRALPAAKPFQRPRRRQHVPIVRPYHREVVRVVPHRARDRPALKPKPLHKPEPDVTRAPVPLDHRHLHHIPPHIRHQRPALHVSRHRQ